MRRIFARTSNVDKFIAAMDRLHQRSYGIPGMALVYGNPGLGRTHTVLWWYSQNNGIYVPAKRYMSPRWLLQEIVSELGASPSPRVADLFLQCKDLLMENPKTIIIDEIDYLIHDAKVEVLRDIHDTTGTPIVMVGMEMADKKLMRFKHLFDRISEIVKFSDLTEQDIKMIIDQICEVKLSADAIQFIYSLTNRFRRLVIWIYRVEAFAKTNGLKEISAAHLREIVG